MAELVENCLEIYMENIFRNSGVENFKNAHSKKNPQEIAT